MAKSKSKSKRTKRDEQGIVLDESEEIKELIEEFVEGDDPYVQQAEVQHKWLDFDPAQQAAAKEQFEVTPHRILEGMLFVGFADDQPLTAEKVASLMRGVRTEEIADFVEDLNEQYSQEHTPYRIVESSDGYTMTLDESFTAIRNRFYSEQKDAELPQTAIDVLSVVAYNQPISKKEVEQIRGRNCGSVLSQLVRRKILQIERTDEKPRRTLYRTTDRFLQLFEIESLDDLPSSQQTEFID